MDVVARPELQQRATPGALAVGALAGCALVASVDPSGSAPYPVCPTRALLGFDCPACGTLRGLHALLNGRLGAALDHNVLLLVAVPVGLVLWGRWVLAALGRTPRSVRLPGWVVPVVAVVAVTFTVARNIPVGPLDWLAA